MESPPQVDGEKCDTVPQGVQELLDGRNRQYPCAAMPKSRRAVPPVYPQPWSHKNQTPLPSPCALTYRAMPCPRRPKTRLQTHRGLETSEPANCQHRPLPDDEGGRTRDRRQLLLLLLRASHAMKRESSWMEGRFEIDTKGGAKLRSLPASGAE